MCHDFSSTLLKVVLAILWYVICNIGFPCCPCMKSSFALFLVCNIISLLTAISPFVPQRGEKVSEFAFLEKWQKKLSDWAEKSDDFLKNPAFHQISNQKMCKSFTNPCAKQKIRILFQKKFHPIVNPLTGWKGGMQQIETSSPLAPLIFKCSQLTGSQQLSTLRSVDKLQYKDQFFLLQPPNLALKLRVCFVFEVRWG